MSMRSVGTHLISWAQTWIDGENPSPDALVVEGATWRWFGVPVRVDGPQGAILLGNAIGLEDLHDRAAGTVRKFFRTHGTDLEPNAHDPSPLYRGGFVVSDGVRFYSIITVESAAGFGRLVVFSGAIPPANVNLTVVKVSDYRPKAAHQGVICFTPGTFIDTPSGPRAVEDLYPGDMVHTKDNGPKEIVWMGLRNISGARLRVSPSLRPIRIKSGAMGQSRPEPDLIVSPEHRVLIKGRKAELLFNTPEVLVRAGDLVNDAGIVRDHATTEVVYVHIMFASHEVVFANGVETESFHPGLADLDHLNAIEREDLEDAAPGVLQSPDLYGPHARRCLSEAEIAILRYDSAPHYLT